MRRNLMRKRHCRFGQWYAGCLGSTVAVLYLAFSSTAQAAYEPQQRMQSLDLPAVAWESAQQLQVADQALHVRPFSSAQTPVQLAKALSEHSDIFQRVLTSKHKITLSGLQPGWHWLAEIHAVPGGTQGYVSALYVEGARLQPPDQDKVLMDAMVGVKKLPFSRN